MMERCTTYYDGREVGHFVDQPNGNIGFSYSAGWYDAWRQGQAHQISVALPVSESDIILDATAFVAGLLPDSVRHRTLLAEEMGIGDTPSDFAFLSKMGRDSAGALVIIPESDKLDRGDKARIEWHAQPEDNFSYEYFAVLCGWQQRWFGLSEQFLGVS